MNYSTTVLTKPLRSQKIGLRQGVLMAYLLGSQEISAQTVYKPEQLAGALREGDGVDILLTAFRHQVHQMSMGKLTTAALAEWVDKVAFYSSGYAAPESLSEPAMQREIQKMLAGTEPRPALSIVF